MQQSLLVSHCGTEKITRDQLATILPPESTETFHSVAHIRIIEALFEALSFRHINVVRDEYAVSRDGMRMFGLLELEYGMEHVNFAIGVRNANDKTMRLAFTVGYFVFICDNLAFYGDFTPVLHKHTKGLELQDLVALGVDKMQRNFEPLNADFRRVKLINVLR